MNPVIKKRLLTIFDSISEIEFAESSYSVRHSSHGGQLVCAVCLQFSIHSEQCVIGQMMKALSPVIPRWSDREKWLAEEENSSQKP